jgi:hypothetical protein
MASLHKNGFGFSILQNFPILNLPPRLQEPMVYIGLNLATNSQLPPRSGLKKGSRSPNIGQNLSKLLKKINENLYYMV